MLRPGDDRHDQENHRRRKPQRDARRSPTETRRDTEHDNRRYEQRDADAAANPADGQQEPAKRIDQHERQNRRREQAKNFGRPAPLRSEHEVNNLLRKDRAAHRHENRRRDDDGIDFQERPLEALGVALCAGQRREGYITDRRPELLHGDVA